MAVHIDSPVAGAALEPAHFRVCGWLWLEPRHADLAAVEILSGHVVLGQLDVSAFYERPDVSSRYGLPPGTLTGFDLVARHPEAHPDRPFVIELRARLRDGTVTAPLFFRDLAPPPLARHPYRALLARVAADSLGLEIGAHTRPAPDLYPFYTDAVVAFAGAAGRVDFLSDATALPVPDDTLDYLVSSHVLEHLPDPLSALHEWHRILKPGGLLYLVVPDKRFTFDAPRPVTTTAHLLHDFSAGTTPAADAVHVDEFVYQTDWSMLHPDVAADDRPSRQAVARRDYLAQIAQGQPIDIHYHTFTPESLAAHLAAAGFTGGASTRFAVVAEAERYPPGRDDGIALLLEKTGPAALVSTPASTYRLPSAQPGGPALPLVCPATLGSLQAGPGGLAGGPEGAVYRLDVDGRPVLFAPTAAPVHRPWSNRSSPLARTSAPVIPATSMSALPLRSHLDEPTAGTVVDPLCCLLRGWLHLGPAHADVAAVEAWSGDTLVGETAALYDRTDVTAALHLPAGTLTGYEIFAHHPAAPAGEPFSVQLRARLRDGTRTQVADTIVLRALARDYRTNHFGILLDRRTTAIQQHSNIFAVGPSQSEGSGELAHLIRRYLGPPPRKLVDVGCGFGSYGRGLLADGYDWLGAEVSASDCAELARLGLPHRHVDGKTLPFPDAAFDAALCIEVLEHIADPRAFLQEVRRVAPHRLIVSVPNCELLGYLWDHLATPWHMLEATHVNFFTRWSLGALLREFYPQVELRFHTPYPLRTVEGTPLHYNLLAIATSGRP